MASQVLALAAWGEPLSASTWSGTPFHVAAALRARGVELIGLNCRPARAQVLSAGAFDRARGFDIGFTRRRLGRASCVRQTALLPPECVGVLHMSSVTVPPRGAAPDVSHFLLCDSLQDFWNNFGADAARQSPRAREAADADEQSAVDALDFAFPIAQHAARSLREYGLDASKIVVVGTGRGKIRALEAPKNYDSKRVLMVAKQRFEDKGGPLLIEAIQIARRTDTRIELTLVSPDEFRPFAQNADGVRVTGTLEWDALQRLFDEAPLYAMPAPCEPWGLVYAEALATKTPILGLHRAAFPELSGEGRFGFSAHDATPEAVARAILDAFSDPDRLRSMGEEGQKYCLERFSWERTAGLIADALWR